MPANKSKISQHRVPRPLSKRAKLPSTQKSQDFEIRQKSRNRTLKKGNKSGLHSSKEKSVRVASPDIRGVRQTKKSGLGSNSIKKMSLPHKDEKRLRKSSNSVLTEVTGNNIQSRRNLQPDTLYRKNPLDKSKSTKRNVSANQGKFSKQVDDDFEGDDLFSKLNAYSKYCDEAKRLREPSSPQKDLAFNQRGNGRIESNANEQQEFEAEEFLLQKVNKIRQVRRSNIEIDYARLVNPSHRKKPTELRNECTFQPMLSKNSLDLASKLGDAKSRLYTQKSINKSKRQSIEVDSDKSFQPRINERSKYLDKKNGHDRYLRHERLGIMVPF